MLAEEIAAVHPRAAPDRVAAAAEATLAAMLGGLQLARAHATDRTRSRAALPLPRRSLAAPPTRTKERLTMMATCSRPGSPAAAFSTAGRWSR